MRTHRVAESIVSPVSRGVVPFSATLRSILSLWQSEIDSLPSSRRLLAGPWRSWAEHGVCFGVRRAGPSAPHGFKAAAFGRVLREEIALDLGPRLVSAESPASFWLNQTIAARAPLLAYGSLEPIGVVDRRGEMLFLPLGQDDVVETILVAVAPTESARVHPAPPPRPAVRVSA
jgi:hypothetical protein